MISGYKLKMLTIMLACIIMGIMVNGEFVSVKTDKELYEDALMLFEYHQNKTFLKTKIFDFVLKGLIDKGAFIYQKKKHYKCHIDGDLYKAPEKVGYHLLNKK